MKIYRNTTLMRVRQNRATIYYRMRREPGRNNHYYLKARRHFRDGDYHEARWMR